MFETLVMVILRVHILIQMEDSSRWQGNSTRHLISTTASASDGLHSEGFDISL